ncbi:MAG TPA: AAA family ATPase, partial [Acidimicrobiales bacterium]|nr:AAA family ATPase [Acidimicrobiales bacterium]
MGSTQAAIVTFLFTDLVGSTATLEELGEDDFDRARRAHFRLLRDRVESSGGSEVKSLGDGLMAVFASAVDAVRCAVEIQRAVAVVDGPMGVRVGLHVGDPIRDDDDYFGRSVVVARRLCDSAGADEIRASALVRELVGSRGGFEFTPLGDVELKGLTTPVGAFRVEYGHRDRAVDLPSVLARAAGEPFVGRDAVVGELEQSWKLAADGSARLALVAGEPGIGKTRLAARVAMAVAGGGGTVVYGRCDEDNLVAYQPFVEALQHLLRGLSEGELTETLGDDLRDLARLLPELARKYGIDHAPTGDAETERYLMFESVARLLARFGRRLPTLVVLDDLHWSDAPTLRLLRHLVRHPEPLPALIIGTYRDTDLDRTHPLASVLADLRREPVATRVLLPGLSSGQIAALLEEMSGHPIDERGRELAAALHRETDGNPFFVREVVRNLVETGTIYQRDGQWTSDLSVERAGIPEGVREVIGRRLSRLDESTNRVLAAASVVGREFDAGLVAQLVSLSEDDVIDLLEMARAAVLVSEVPGAIDRYAFTHALVRQALYDELATSRRVRLHRRAAEAIEATAGDTDPPLFELARHYLEAGEASIEKAVEYAQRAAAHAMVSLAYEEAARLIERALEAIDPDDVTPVVRSGLLMQLGEARVAAGDVSGATDAFAAGVDVARAVDDPEHFARCVLAAVGPAEASVMRIGGRELLLEAQNQLPTVPSPLRARLLARRAAAYATPLPSGELQETDTAQALAEEAQEMARALGDLPTLGDVARSNMYVVAFGGQFAGPRRAAADELARLADESDDPDLALTALGWQFGSALAYGEVERAHRHLADYQAGAARFRRPADRYYGLVWEQVLALFAGEFDRA